MLILNVKRMYKNLPHKFLKIISGYRTTIAHFKVGK